MGISSDDLRGRLIRYIEEDDPWEMRKAGRNLERSVYILEVLWESKKDIILDLGGGFGFYSEFLRTSGKRVVCCDLSRRMVTEGKKMFPELEFVRCDVCNLPFKPESFDSIICMGIYIYI